MFKINNLYITYYLSIYEINLFKVNMSFFLNTVIIYKKAKLYKIKCVIVIKEKNN